MSRLLGLVLSDLPLRILALFTAVVMWFAAVLDHSYVTNIAVPIVIDRVETKKAISDFETRAATVKLEGKGWNLLGLRFRQSQFRLTVPEGLAGIHRLRLNPTDLQLPPGLLIRSIVPEHAELRLKEVDRRRVALEVPVRGRTPDGLAVTEIKPLAKVDLVGPQDEIDLFATVSTESLDLSAIRRSDTFTLAVTPPEGEGFSTEPSSVAVAVNVEKEGARIFLGVAVQVKAPAPRQVTIEPSEAQIAVAGPSTLLDQLELSEITVRLDVSELDPGRHQVAAEITLPPEFHLVKCEPPLFRVTIR